MVHKPPERASPNKTPILLNGKPSFKSFEIVGTAELSTTKRSVRFKITPVYSVLDEYYYVGVKALEKLLNGRNKTATIYVRREKET